MALSSKLKTESWGQKLVPCTISTEATAGPDKDWKPNGGTCGHVDAELCDLWIANTLETTLLGKRRKGSWSISLRRGLSNHPFDDQNRILLQLYLASPGMKAC